MRNLVCFLILLTLSANPFAKAQDRTWTFESPPEGLEGDASIAPVGPNAEFFEGMPESNRALKLDGKGDFLRVIDSGENSDLDFDQGDPISIEAWIRLDSISSGQNVYIVGKGRTHIDGPADNQNYALRMRGVGGDARASFLFRSRDGDQHQSDWHRWTSKSGFWADGNWHHVAVTYRFGEPKSIHGYIDGKPVSGSWDMGGATEQPPVVDDDELWIGSSMGGSAGNSFRGAIDNLVISREITPRNEFANRRIPIFHPPKPPTGKLLPDVVNVALYENVGSEREWPVRTSEPLMQWQQSGFALPRIPLAYGDGGARRDWNGPVMVTAMAELPLPTGSSQWMLRAGGLSRLWIDDQVVVQTAPHLRNTSGHGAVTRYPQDDPWLRPRRAGHHEETATHKIANKRTRIALQTVVGGKDLRYEAGEILVAYRSDEDESWQVLTMTGGVPLTDEAWTPLASQIESTIQRVDDRNRRLTFRGEDESWKRRHQHAHQYVQSLDPIPVPDGSELPDNGPIDRFINAKIHDSGKEATLTDLSSDDRFVRRLYLDVTGVIPTVDEIRSFATMPGDANQRRFHLIDQVLDDPRWADHWTAYWMDVLAENPNVLKPSLNNSGPFRWYLYDMMRDNVAVDRWVTGLIQMKGSVRGGGPAGFGMAAQNDVPMAAKAHVLTSAFLGANMKCARCHDAPYHEWTQRDLFSIAAMLEKKPLKIPKTSTVPDEFFGDDADASLITVSLKPGESVSARWPLKKYVAPEADELQTKDSREELALQLTRPENQQFARTLVNRIWRQLMGEGLVDPVNDWEAADVSHPQLLEYLARELTANEYDCKHVARLILRSRAYQRTAVDRPKTADASQRFFASPRMRRMSAEQIVDSLHIAAGRPMDAGELTFDPEARMNPSAQGNLGRPRRAWQLTSLSNERDRPALSLPRAAAVTECLEAFGWSGSRQDPINHRQTDANVLQPGILGGGLLSVQLTRLTDDSEVTKACLQAATPEELVENLFQRCLTRSPNEAERSRFVGLLKDGFEKRVLSSPSSADTPIREPNVSWANHLHPEATEIRLRQADRLRLGPSPSRWLQTEWRERAEDALWALMNTPEFLFIR